MNINAFGTFTRIRIVGRGGFRRIFCSVLGRRARALRGPSSAFSAITANLEGSILRPRDRTDGGSIKWSREERVRW